MPDIPLMISTKHTDVDVSDGGSEVVLNFSPPMVLPRESDFSIRMVEYSGVNSFINVSDTLKNNTLTLKQNESHSITVADATDTIEVGRSSTVQNAKFHSIDLYQNNTRPHAHHEDNLTWAYRLPSEMVGVEHICTMASRSITTYQ